jgi:RNA polymerase sigma-54 factor
MFQLQNQELRPQITAHLAQTMSLLEMTREEIQQKIELELANNPALEILEERRCPNCNRVLTSPGPCPICSRPYNPRLEEPIVFISSREDFHAASNGARQYQGRDDLPEDNYATQQHDLPTYIYLQISPELSPSDHPIAEYILSNLDKDGLLRIPHLEISQYFHVSSQTVSRILQHIQEADPVGVGAASPQEALLIQLQSLQKTRQVPSKTEQVIRDGMELLSRHKYRQLAREMNISLPHAKSIADFIRSNLNPYPARAKWGGVRQGPDRPPEVYYSPDIIIKKQKNNHKCHLIVEIISPYRGLLRVNPLFRQAIQKAPTEKAENWKQDLENASLLIKCLQQRNHTMKQLMSTLVVRQQQFLLTNDPIHLNPMTQAEMAELLDVHESTISRAVSDKAVQIPNRKIIPLKKFFDRSLPARITLKRIIEEEETPHTDSELADLLSEKGFPVARRTVAKYRSMEGILSSRMRNVEN